MLLDVRDTSVVQEILLTGARIVGKVLNEPEKEVRFKLDRASVLVEQFVEGRVMYSFQVPNAVKVIMELDSGIYNYDWYVDTGRLIIKKTRTK